MEYKLQKDCDVSLKLYDVLGREVRTLFEGEKAAGTHSLEYDASKLPNGTYLLVISSENEKKVAKMVVTD